MEDFKRLKLDWLNVKEATEAEMLNDKSELKISGLLKSLKKNSKELETIEEIQYYLDKKSGKEGNISHFIKKLNASTNQLLDTYKQVSNTDEISDKAKHQFELFIRLFEEETLLTHEWKDFGAEELYNFIIEAQSLKLLNEALTEQVEEATKDADNEDD